VPAVPYMTSIVRHDALVGGAGASPPHRRTRVRPGAPPTEEEVGDTGLSVVEPVLGAASCPRRAGEPPCRPTGCVRVASLARLSRQLGEKEADACRTAVEIRAVRGAFAPFEAPLPAQAPIPLLGGHTERVADLRAR